MALKPEEIAELSRWLPHRPGVYLMEDAKARVIYVGKAKDLQKRVLSYFQESRAHPAKLRALVRRTAKVQVLVVDSEKEALILEATLIKRHRPWYNVQLRDDKAYPLIRLSLAWEHPQLAIVRRKKKDGHRYFGPYVSAKAARSTLNLMNRLFPLRKCRGPQPPVRSRPCRHHQLGQCLGPCCNQILPAVYQGWVEEAELFLSGRLKEVSKRLEAAMRRAAQEERFEEAAALRDRLKAIETTLEKQVVVSADNLDRDVFGFRAGPTGLAVAVLFVRQGALVGSRSFFLKGIEQADRQVTAQAVSQFYANKTALPDQILLPARCQDQDLVAEWLTEVKGARLKIVVPQRGQGRALLARAEANAESALPLLAGSPQALAAQGLEELGRKLGLKTPPHSLEGFDISIHHKSHPVGSMVRFEDGRPVRSKYRNYKIKTV
ncbi:MAG: excinuclease ABC subunit UvrC, partial [Deltaproteobacteria bacterium]|nr:excinuclease ABC subunit UvrC [Deltaproteobacteria bacterium]